MQEDSECQSWELSFLLVDKYAGWNSHDVCPGKSIADLTILYFRKSAERLFNGDMARYSILLFIDFEQTRKQSQ